MLLSLMSSNVHANSQIDTFNSMSIYIIRCNVVLCITADFIRLPMDLVISVGLVVHFYHRSSSFGSIFVFIRFVVATFRFILVYLLCNLFDGGGSFILLFVVAVCFLFLSIGF